MADNTTTLNDNHYYLSNIGLNIQYYKKKKFNSGTVIRNDRNKQSFSKRNRSTQCR